jgi:enterochelin esterase-like enzyme
MPRARIRALAAATVCLVAGVLLTAPLAHGKPSASTVLDQTFYSSQVRGTLRYRVYLPTGYRSSSERYPVIYLLHGLPSDGTNYRDAKIDGVGVSAERAGRPAIVVAPQASRPGDTDPEFHDWGAGRNWESAIASDLVRTIDRGFRTIASARARGLIGVSAGGYGAAIIAVHRPKVFSVAQSWSGYFSPTDPAARPLSVGDAAANRRASVHSYVGWLAKTRAVRLQFYVGQSDARFKADNLRLDHELTQARVAHEFGIYPGGHSVSLWSAHERQWVSSLVGRLSKARTQAST